MFPAFCPGLSVEHNLFSTHTAYLPLFVLTHLSLHLSLHFGRRGNREQMFAVFAVMKLLFKSPEAAGLSQFLSSKRANF